MEKIYKSLTSVNIVIKHHVFLVQYDLFHITQVEVYGILVHRLYNGINLYLNLNLNVSISYDITR